MTSPQHPIKNILIIGHGLVGAVLARTFQAHGCAVTVWDRDTNDSASKVAAGLITPITGKGMNPSARIEEFFEEAVHFFSDDYTETKILRLFKDAKEVEKFRSKQDAPNVARWVINELAPDETHTDHHNTFGGFEMHGGWVNTVAFLKQSRRRLTKQGAFTIRSCSADDLHELKEDYDAIFLSRGAFEFLENDAHYLNKTRSGTHRCAKGEILTVRIPDLNESRILNRNGWLMPYDLEHHLYRAGATFEWDDLDVNPTQLGRSIIEEKIRSLVKHPFEVIDHQAGIRPIARNSQPFVEAIDERCWVVNGFGSKGTLYAPRAARELAEYLCEGRSLDPWYQL